MKKLTILFVFSILSNFLFAQFSIDTVETKKGTRILNHEIGFNYQTFAGTILDGSPGLLSLNLTYKKNLISGNALRYSINFERENNLFINYNQNTVNISPTGKTILNKNRDQNITYLGFGWEYRKPTTEKFTLFIALDGLVGYRNSREKYLETTYKANGDSIFYGGNSSIKVPDYDFEDINQIESLNSHSFALGLRSHLGILWALSDRFLLSTAMEVRGLYTLNTTQKVNGVTGEKSSYTSSTLDFNQKLIGDLSLFYRF